jgi:hypothetical protein
MSVLSTQASRRSTIPLLVAAMARVEEKPRRSRETDGALGGCKSMVGIDSRS